MPKVDNVDLISTHPAIAEFLLRERVKTLITLDYFESKGRAKMQMQNLRSIWRPRGEARFLMLRVMAAIVRRRITFTKRLRKLYKYYDQSSLIGSVHEGIRNGKCQVPQNGKTASLAIPEK